MEKLEFNEETKRAQKDYEKEASKRAGDYASLWDRIRGKNKVKKEDIMRADAEFESELTGSKSLLFTPEEQKAIKKVIDSTLRTEENVVHSELDASDREIMAIMTGRMLKGKWEEETLKGNVDGQEIEITAVKRDKDMSEKQIRTGSVPEYHDFEGTINGKKISPDKAEKIFNHFHWIVEKRDKSRDEKAHEAMTDGIEKK